MLDEEAAKHRQQTRRALMLGGIKAVLFLTLTSRLAYLQLWQGDKYRTLSDANRINLRLVAPVRGLITDRLGRKLAENTQNFRVQIIPEETDDIEASLNALSTVLPLSGDVLERVIARAKTQPGFIPLEIADNITWVQVSTIEVNRMKLPGISVEAGQTRYYPEGLSTAHAVGYVGAVNKDELKENPDPVKNLPGFRIGKFGLERSYDTNLRGTPGESRIEVNVEGRTVRELETIEGVQGEKLQTTLDIDLQKRLQDRLNLEKSAAAIIMDSHTGAIYAMASAPSFDPNLFATSIPFTTFNQLNTDETKPLMNKAVSGQYPPGSTFKIITLLAGLQAGVIKPDSRVYCPGYLDVGDHRFHCWKHAGHGTMDCVSAMSQSCDTFFYEFARDIGIDRIAAMARRFGLGKKFNQDILEARSGLVPDRKWKQNHKVLHKEAWLSGETIVHAIGQGYLLATPLQMAVMTARLVNGGYGVEPWFILRRNNVLTAPARIRWPKMGIKPEHLRIAMDGMIACVNAKGGTAHGLMVDDPDRMFAGKTGTSQVKRITKEERAEGVRRQEDIEWKFRHHALFVGYAPIDRPRYVTAVVVEHGGSGSLSAAPIGKLALQAALDLEPASWPTGRV